MLPIFGSSAKKANGEGLVCFGVCEAPLNDWANDVSVSVDDFYTYGSMILVLVGVGTILGNGYGI